MPAKVGIQLVTWLSLLLGEICIKDGKFVLLFPRGVTPSLGLAWGQERSQRTSEGPFCLAGGS